MIHDSITDTIGRTPIIRLNRLAPDGIALYAKLESFNPGGSVKDRLALAIILDAEQRGALRPGQTVIEATSGNTGIALAMVCAARGYPFVAVMSETFSIERRKLIRVYGGKVILTAAAERGSGMVRRAEALAAQHGWFLARQFENEANPSWHRNTTAPEILSDFAGRRLDVFVSGWGTGGTLSGAGAVLKAARPGLKVIAAEPAVAPLLAGGDWSPHRIQGWTPDFVPKVLDRDVIDRVLPIDDAEARSTSLRLAREEGIFVGISAGATAAAALRIARELSRGSSVLAMLPDTGERYLSTFLFEGVDEGSDEAWLEGLGGGRSERERVVAARVVVPAVAAAAVPARSQVRTRSATTPRTEAVSMAVSPSYAW